MFHKLVNLNWRGGLDSVASGRSLLSWDKASDGRFSPYIRGVRSVIVMSVLTCDRPWLALARDHLGVLDNVYHDYLTQGNSVLLVKLVHFMRRAIPPTCLLSILCDHFPTLTRAIRFLDCSVISMPCGIKSFEKPTKRSHHIPILCASSEIRYRCIALHQGADGVYSFRYLDASSSDFSGPLDVLSSYPVCNVPGHRSQLTLNIHEVVAAVSTEAPATISSAPSPSPIP